MVKDASYTKIKDLLENTNNNDYKSIINLSKNPITITSFNGVYKEVNQSYVDIIGYSREEIINNSSVDLNIWLHVKDRYKFIPKINKNGFVRNLQINLISKSGKIWKANMSADLIVLKGERLILGITEDVLEVKEPKEVLIDIITQEKELADIIRKAPIAITMGGVDGKVSSFNKATSNLLGYSEGELSYINWMDLTPSKWHKLEEERFNELRKYKKTVSYEKEYIKKDGSIIPVEIVVSAVFDKKLNLAKFISFITNIDKRKQMENMVSNGQLLRAVGEMASSVAHDFNNSLQIITGNIELLQELPEMTPEIKDYIETIAVAVQDASQRVKSLQALGDKKETKREFQLISVKELLNEVVIQTRPLWKNKKEKVGLNIDIEKFYEEGLNIVGNIAELRTVFYNIIVNSIEAITGNGTIKISTQKVDNNITIEIIDNGIGMNEEVIANIFQPFYSTKSFGLGRGLGMSGVYSIVKEHNGNIDLKSKPNKGTSFIVTLPCNEFEFEFQEDEFVEKYLKKLRVLWVDDEVMLQKLAKKILTKLGHKGYIAVDGVDALNMISKEAPFDLIITDIGMPNMNGWQLIKEVRKELKDNIKIIVLTGWGGEISEEKKENYDIDGILEKPIKIEDLKNCISKVMNKTLKKH